MTCRSDARDRLSRDSPPRGERRGRRSAFSRCFRSATIALATAAVLTASGGCSRDRATVATTTSTTAVTDPWRAEPEFFDGVAIPLERSRSGVIELDNGSAALTDSARQPATAVLGPVGLVLRSEGSTTTAALSTVVVAGPDGESTVLVLVERDGSTRRATSLEIEPNELLVDAWWAGEEITVATATPPGAEATVIERVLVRHATLRLDRRVAFPLLGSISVPHVPGAATSVPATGEVALDVLAPGDLRIRGYGTTDVTVIDAAGRTAFDNDPDPNTVVSRSQTSGSYRIIAPARSTESPAVVVAVLAEGETTTTVTETGVSAP